MFHYLAKAFLSIHLLFQFIILQLKVFQLLSVQIMSKIKSMFSIAYKRKHKTI